MRRLIHVCRVREAPECVLSTKTPSGRYWILL
jgi:hypothetical protein